MEKQIEAGKTTIQLCSIPKSRRQRFFLICGTCNIVSIAENTPNDGKTGVKNNTGLEEKKGFTSVREALNDDDKCTPDHEEKSWVDVSNDSSKKSHLDDFQSLKKGMADDLVGKMGRYASTKKKVCWSDRDKHDTCKVHDQSSVDSFSGQERSNPSQSDFEQNKPPSRKASLKLHRADERTNSEEALMQRLNPTAKREAWLADPSQSHENVASVLPLADNSTLPSKNPSNTPEIKINDAVVKPAWSGDEAEVTTTPANRWKRLAPIKFKINRIQGKRRERDAAVVREEYEIMMENLKQYGVL